MICENGGAVEGLQIGPRGDTLFQGLHIGDNVSLNPKGGENAEDFPAESF
jgi:hypothetical protein